MKTNTPMTDEFDFAAQHTNSIPIKHRRATVPPCTVAERSNAIARFACCIGLVSGVIG